MRRMGCLLGVFLILVAVVALFAVVVLPVIPGVGDIPILISIQGALFCPAGQTYGHDRSSYSVRPGETFLALESYCVNENGDQISFTQDQEVQRLVVSALSFVIPFLMVYSWSSSVSAALPDHPPPSPVRPQSWAVRLWCNPRPEGWATRQVAPTYAVTKSHCDIREQTASSIILYAMRRFA
jgi:hypothetical protein